MEGGIALSKGLESLCQYNNFLTLFKMSLTSLSQCEEVPAAGKMSEQRNVPKVNDCFLYPALFVFVFFWRGQKSGGNISFTVRGWTGETRHVRETVS